jgi:hypothetical protein
MSFDPFSVNHQAHSYREPDVREPVPTQETIEDRSDPLTLIRGVQSLLQTRLNEAERMTDFDDKMSRSLVDGATKLTTLLLRYQHQLEAMTADQTFEAIVLEVLKEMSEEMKIDFIGRVEERLKANQPARLAA